MLTEIARELKQFLWAKLDPYVSMEKHAEDTAKVALYFLTASSYKNIVKIIAWALNLTEQEVLDLVEYLARTHDIGKIHMLFVEKAKERMKDLNDYILSHIKLFSYSSGNIPYRHEMGGSRILYYILKEHLFDDDEIEFLTSLLRFHHQKDYGSECKLNKIKHKEWVQLQQEFEAEIAGFVRPKPGFLINANNVALAEFLLLGVLVISDWIASSLETNPISGKSFQKQVMDFFKEHSLLEGKLPDTSSFCNCCPSIKKGHERGIQKKVEEIIKKNGAPILMVIEAPMGEGKTKTAFYAAACMSKEYSRSGICDLMPTGVTSDSVNEEMEQWLRQHGIDAPQLIHGTSWLTDTGDDNWFNNSKKKMFAPYWTGTIDHSLLSVIKAKNNELRFLSMMNKTVIMDEVHAYQIYMGSSLLKSLEWFKISGTPAVLLSATLPPTQLRKILAIYTNEKLELKSAYPMITCVYKDGKVKQFPVDEVSIKNTYDFSVSKILNQPKRIAVKAVEKVKNGGVLGIYLNTIRQERELYDAIMEILPNDCELLLFHADFNVAQKNAIKKQCLEIAGHNPDLRSKKAIVILNQIGEQSLNLDFDWIFSANAPIDSLFQRMGRCFRYKDTIRPIEYKCPDVTLLVPKDGKYKGDNYIYYDLILSRTYNLLKDRSTISTPDDIPDLINKVYNDELQKDDNYYEWAEKNAKESALLSESESHQIPSPQDADVDFLRTIHLSTYEDESASARLIKPSVQIGLLPEKYYNRIKEAEKTSSRLSRDEEVLLYSYSANIKTDKLRVPILESEEIVRGTGNLKYTYFLPATNDYNQAPEETILYRGNGIVIVYDKNTGIEIDSEE